MNRLELMDYISIGHVLLTKITEATEGSSFWTDEVPFKSFNIGLAFNLVWVHVCINTCWAEADDVNSIFEFISERLTHVSRENF